MKGQVFAGVGVPLCVAYSETDKSQAYTAASASVRQGLFTPRVV